MGRAREMKARFHEGGEEEGGDGKRERGELWTLSGYEMHTSARHVSDRRNAFSYRC